MDATVEDKMVSTKSFRTSARFNDSDASFMQWLNILCKLDQYPITIS